MPSLRDLARPSVLEDLRATGRSAKGMLGNDGTGLMIGLGELAMNQGSSLFSSAVAAPVAAVAAMRANGLIDDSGHVLPGYGEVFNKIVDRATYKPQSRAGKAMSATFGGALTTLGDAAAADTEALAPNASPTVKAAIRTGINALPIIAGARGPMEAVARRVQSVRPGPSPGTPMAQRGAVGYHGMPHAIPPEEGFRLDKAGTGEGADGGGSSSFGAGVNISSSPAVADTYRAPFQPDAPPEQGNRYTVHVPDEHVENMLDWQAPISEQPAAVQAALGKLLPPSDQWFHSPTEKPVPLAGADPAAMKKYQFIHDNAPLQGRIVSNGLNDLLSQGGYGSHAYAALSRVLGSPEAASRALHEAGVPGITYRDMDPAAGPEGAQNMTVFDPSTVSITHVNDIPLPVEQQPGPVRGRVVQVRPGQQTVMRPKRNGYPGVYADPEQMVAEAASRVAPEDPLLKQLFGVTRKDLWDISQGGQRQGNMPEVPFKRAANPQGAAAAQDVTNPRNVARLRAIIAAARQHPELYEPMAAWYTMDPLYQHFQRLHNDPVKAYNQWNALTGMASPGSEVLAELNRGSAANMLAEQGRFDDFVRHGGTKVSARGADFPPDMEAVIPHPYHPTAHARPMGKYLRAGEVDMGSAKVPSYIRASGVPETGFQTQWPIGDAHWSRLVGLTDTRGAKTVKGVEVLPNASASVPEMNTLAPWWKDRVAAPEGLEAVPAQAVIWGAGSGATGVTSPIGAGKLELLAQQIGKAAKRMGVSPELARDMILTGRAHAGFISPEMAALLGSATVGGLTLQQFLSQPSPKPAE